MKMNLKIEGVKEVGMEPRCVEIKKAISLFSKHQDYALVDEMRSGIYQREYLALNIIINRGY